MRRLILAGLAALALAACGTRGGPAATPTAMVLAQGTSPLATAAPPSATVAVPTDMPASTETPVLEVTATADGVPTAEPGLAAAGSDPLLRTYRAMVAIQLNAALVAETVTQVQAGRLDEEEMPVAALA